MAGGCTVFGRLHYKMALLFYLKNVQKKWTSKDVQNKTNVTLWL